MTAKKGAKKGEDKVPTKDEVVESAKVTVLQVANQIEREEVKFITYPRAQLDQIKTVYAKGASDIEFANFVLVSVRTGLDIFKKQIYLVPRWDSRIGANIFTPQCGIDGFRAVAERTNAYAGNDDAIFKGEVAGESKDVKYPAEATVTVYKIVQGVRCPFVATARWKEYYPGDKQGFMWKTKPHIMLSKCAEALALRKAFPNVIQGFYESAELDMSVAQSAPDDKQKKGLEKIKEIVSKFNEKECAEYSVKIAKSDKYTAEQKKELEKLVAERVKFLTEVVVTVDDGQESQ
ncbi:MAG: phage recombination protein Bet [Minisyncoccia bacterium]